MCLTKSYAHRRTCRHAFRALLRYAMRPVGSAVKMGSLGLKRVLAVTTLTLVDQAVQVVLVLQVARASILRILHRFESY